MLQPLLLLTVIAPVLGQIQQLLHPRQLLRVLLAAILRAGNLVVPPLPLQLIVLLLQTSALMLPVVSLLLTLLQAHTQSAQRLALVFTLLLHPLQLCLAIAPILHGSQQGLPLGRQGGQGLALFEPACPLLTAGLQLLYSLGLSLTLLLQLLLQGPRLGALLLDLLQQASPLPDAGIEILRLFEYRLQRAPLPLCIGFFRYQLLLMQQGLLLIQLNPGKFRRYLVN
ncbi:hypothetical protein D3C79_755050 [compost metagenome]